MTVPSVPGVPSVRFSDNVLRGTSIPVRSPIPERPEIVIWCTPHLRRSRPMRLWLPLLLLAGLASDAQAGGILVPGGDAGQAVALSS